MKQFNRFLGILSIIFFLLLLVSVIVGVLYASANQNQFQNWLRWSFHNNHLNLAINDKKASDYDTVEIQDSQIFETKENLVIHGTMEKVLFIKEDRSDIMIEYYNKKPDTHLYSVDYNMESSKDTIYFHSTYKIQNLFPDLSYDSYIKIYVPNNYQCDRLDITMSMGDIKNNQLLEEVKNLSITANLGNIDIIVTTPKENLSLASDMGNISLTTKEKINSLDITCNFGDISVHSEEPIESLWCSADLGNIRLEINQINQVNIHTNMGNISSAIRGSVNHLKASADVGNIELTVYNNKDATVFTSSDLGNVNCDLPLVKQSEEADFELATSMGNISVQSLEE